MGYDITIRVLSLTELHGRQTADFATSELERQICAVREAMGEKLIRRVSEAVLQGLAAAVTQS